MPGIVGVFDPGCPPSELAELLNRICHIVTHEPWYQTHTYIQPPLAAGRIGLGIINPQPQPVSNEDGSILVWMDGEVYDFQRQALTQQLRKAGHQVQGNGDAELIAHLYEDLGEACVHDLDGTFAVAIYDFRLAKLMIAVDRDASRPLYFYTGKGRFLFGCEVKAILQDERVPRQVNEQGVAELFAFRHVLADRTLIEDVQFLPAGFLAIFQDGQTQVRSYWAPAVIEDSPPCSYDDYVDVVIAALQRALKRQMYDDRPIGEFLSSGLDSRALAGLMPLLNGRFHTFTRGPKNSWDVKFGAMVAERLGSQHHWLNLKPDFLLEVGKKGIWITDGLMTVNDIYMLSIIKEVKPHVDIVFLGNGRCGVDDVGLGSGSLEVSTLDEVANIFFAGNGIFIPPDIQARVLSEPFYQRTRGIAFDALRQMLNQYNSNTSHGLVEAFCIQCRWPRSSLWGAILSRTQVETRSPYSDNEFCDLACRIPARMRLHRQMLIEVIKRSRPDLAQIPWDYTGLPISRSTAKRILLRRIYFRARRELEYLTRGLIPSVTARERANYSLWYRTVLRPWLEDALLSERTLARGYYDPDGIRQLVADHMARRANYAVQFGLLITFELWARMFIDGEAP